MAYFPLAASLSTFLPWLLFATSGALRSFILSKAWLLVRRVGSWEQEESMPRRSCVCVCMCVYQLLHLFSAFIYVGRVQQRSQRYVVTALWATGCKISQAWSLMHHNDFTVRTDWLLQMRASILHNSMISMTYLALSKKLWNLLYFEISCEQYLPHFMQHLLCPFDSFFFFWDPSGALKRERSHLLPFPTLSLSLSRQPSPPTCLNVYYHGPKVVQLRWVFHL